MKSLLMVYNRQTSVSRAPESLSSSCAGPATRPLGAWIITVAVWLLVSLAVAPSAESADGNRRTVQGRYLTLTSDFAEPVWLQDLVDRFDEAVPQWLAFWDVPQERAARWRLQGFLMADEAAFRSDGTLPANVPTFRFGYASADTIWVQRQSTLYYTRHLVLHEGVHALGLNLFGGCGPSWYMEGTAELLATHRDRPAVGSRQESDLESPGNLGLLAQPLFSSDVPFRINQIPRTRDEAPVWGRFRVVEEARRNGNLPTLESVLQLPQNLNADVPSYTWAWAAAMLLSEYPDTRPVFVQAARDGQETSAAFTADVYRKLRSNWPVIQARWRLMLHDLEYGFDWNNHRVTLSTKDPRYDRRPIRLEVSADRSWQSAGYWFPAGTVLKLSANGDCRVNDPETASATQRRSMGPADDRPRRNSEAASQEGRDWIAKPPGITAAFHHGVPLGQLQVVVLPIRGTGSGDQLAPLPVRPAVGLDARRVVAESGGVDETAVTFLGPVLKLEQPSWLLLRIALPPHTRSEASAAAAKSYTVSLQSVPR